jgi:isopentenyl-diphosphate delta-isomerase
MQELWQLYDEQGQPLSGKGITKKQAAQGVLHGVAHVWIWRQNGKHIEVLWQQRARSKMTWPGLFDISAAGHINLGETPLDAAIRETQEEIGLDVATADLMLFNVFRTSLLSGDSIENEFQWLYSLELQEDCDFTLQASEVDTVLWKPLSTLRAACKDSGYVPHGSLYYQLVLEMLSNGSTPGYSPSN